MLRIISDIPCIGEFAENALFKAIGFESNGYSVILLTRDPTKAIAAKQTLGAKFTIGYDSDHFAKLIEGAETLRTLADRGVISGVNSYYANVTSQLDSIRKELEAGTPFATQLREVFHHDEIPVSRRKIDACHEKAKEVIHGYEEPFAKLKEMCGDSLVSHMLARSGCTMAYGVVIAIDDEIYTTLRCDDEQPVDARDRLANDILNRGINSL